MTATLSDISVAALLKKLLMLVLML